MKRNESNLDQVIRLILGVTAAIVGYNLSIGWLYIVALVLIVTGATGYCGLYSLFGFSTYSKRKKK